MKTKNIELRLMSYPDQDVDVWAIPALEVKKVLDNGEIPLITLPDADERRFPRIAIILAQDVHPSRPEPDYSIFPDYVEAILNFDAEPYFIAYDKIKEQLDAIEPDGILLIGGCFETPASWYDKNVKNVLTSKDKRANAYLQILDYAKTHKLPTLGICAGEQMLAGFEGCKMRQGIEGHKIPAYEYAHPITIEKNTLLSACVEQSEFKVNSSHREIVDTLSPNVKAVAYSDDGLIEAVELTNPWADFVLGVQWHPERLLTIDDEPSELIFQNFIQACI